MLSLGNKLSLTTQPIYKFVNKYSVQFDGSDQRIITDGADTIAQPTTYSFWCKSSTTTANAGVFGHGGTAIGAFHFNYSNNRPAIDLGGSAFRYWVENDEQDDGEWHHWVVYVDTNDVTNSKLYIDSVLQTPDFTGSGSASPYTESLTIGSDRQVGGNSFEGKIDEFAVYDRELTQAEITRMYNTYYSPNRVANGNFSQIGNEEVTNGDFSQIGSELVTNGDFATDSNWNNNVGNDWQIVNGKLILTTTSFNNINQGGLGLVQNKFYKIVFTITNTTLGGVRIRLGTGSFSSTYTNGTHTLYLQQTTTNDAFRFYSDSSGVFNGEIDNVSVKEVGQDFIFSTGWGMGDGKAVCDGSQTGNSGLQQSGVAVSGKIYKIQFDLTVDAGFINYVNLGGWIDNTNLTTSGTYTYYTSTTTATDNLGITGNVDFVGSVDNITVKEVGQHWTFGNVGGNNGWRITDTNAICDTNASVKNRNIASDFSLVSGKDYKLTIDILQSADNMQVLVGSTTLSATLPTGTNLAYEYTISGADHTGGVLAFYAGTSDLQEIDNIVVQELKHDATNLMLNHSEYQSANPLITSTKSMLFFTDDYMEVQDDSSLQLEGSAASWTFWTRLDSLSGGDQKFIAKAVSSGSDLSGYQIRTDNADLLFQFFSGSWRTATSSSFFTDLNWVNVTVTIDASNIVRIYKNGVETHNSNIGYSIPANTGEMLFGARTPAVPVNFLDGDMTEVGIYNRCLTALEVASLYNQGMPTNLLVNRNNYQSGNPTVFNTKQVDFDGVDDRLEANSTLGSFTGSVSFWVKRTDSASHQYLIDFRKTSGTGYVYVEDNTGTIFVSSGTVYVDGVAGTTISEDNWHNIVVTGITLNITECIVFGSRYTYSQFFKGDMSQVGLWNSTLTADEVSSLYNHGLPIDLTTDQAAYASSSNLVGYWRMGSGTLDTYPLIADQTNATLGSELVTNGDFATDSDWTKGTGWTISGGTASFNTTTNGSISQSGYATNKTYKVSIDIVSYVRGNPFIAIGQGSQYTIPTSIGTHIIYVNSGSTDTILRIYSGQFGAGGEGSIDNVSVKQVQGNPAIMINLGGGADFSDGIKNGSPYANLVQNGDFSEGSTDWTITSDWTLGINKVTFDDTTTNYIAQNSPSIVNGKSYKIQFTVLDCPSTANIQIYNRSHNTIFIANENWSNGTYTRYFTSTVDSSGYAIWGNTNLDTFALTDITITEVNTGLQGYWKMGDGTNDEYPVIYDQVDPTLGAELVTNGDFATDSDWVKDSGWTIANGKATNDGSSGQIYQELSLEIGKKYVVRGVIDASADAGLSNTAFQIRYNSNAGSITQLLSSSGQISANTINYLYLSFTATETNSLLRVYSADNVSFYNPTVKEVQGNPATMTNMVEGNITNQYPLTKIRNYYRMGDGILDGYPIIQDQTSPNLAHIPTTNLVNDNDTHTLFGVTKTTVSPPSGYTGNAYRFTETIANAQHFGRQDVGTVTSGVTYTMSMFVKSSYSSIMIYTNTAQINSNVTVDTINGTMSGTTPNKISDAGDGWWYIQWTQTAQATANTSIYLVVKDLSVYTGSTSNFTEYFGVQLEAQSQATPFLKSSGVNAVRKSSTTNLITYSEDFSQYSLSNGTITSTNNISPIGTNDATLITPTSSDCFLREMSNSLTSGTVYTVSVYLKSNTGSNFDNRIRLRTSTSSQDVSKDITVTTEWQRFSLTISATQTDNYQLWIGGGATWATGENLLLWGVQLEQQTQAETYAKTTGLPVTIDLFTENNYGTMTNMSASDIVEDTP